MTTAPLTTAPLTSAPRPASRNARTARSLLQILREVAADPALPSLLEPHPVERRWVQVPGPADLQLWLIAWPTGTGTGWHDHGAVSAGAFTTLAGRLTEHTWHSGPYLRTLGPGQDRSFPAGHIHDVRNQGRVPALSLHAYTPRLTTMSRYHLHDGRLRLTSVEAEGEEW